MRKLSTLLLFLLLSGVSSASPPKHFSATYLCKETISNPYAGNKILQDNETFILSGKIVMIIPESSVVAQHENVTVRLACHVGEYEKYGPSVELPGISENQLLSLRAGQTREFLVHYTGNHFSSGDNFILGNFTGKLVK